MSQTPITVTYSLEEILSRIEGKIDKLDEKFTDKIDKLDAKFTDQINKLDAKFTDQINKLDDKIDKLTVEVANCTTNINNLDKRVEKLEGTQKNQIWTLITLLGGSLIAVGFRAFFMDNNP
ncbi:hypothetical protein [Limnofasciculus baicalensis]|uniref:Uncharacterized protein n=2 Tax=Limnofasciculus TaxID=3064905 RepID=A0AAE3GQF7_9CYAN|nr:hypothetical protein [Limnofasciculus baicalensis]MCP2728172.1 hypothetical protein [Limnofasciculus baicalensis BBK-W-15]MCP2728173.1 hypothetical protein [Limnofasciculus baicalensis BBK-W-15]